MWRWQSKGVCDAIPGLCSREGRAGLPGGQGGAARAGGAAGQAGQPEGGQGGRVTLPLKGWLTEVLSPSSEVGTGR